MLEVVAEAREQLEEALRQYEDAYQGRIEAIKRQMDEAEKEHDLIQEKLDYAIDEADTHKMMQLTTEKSGNEATLELLKESLRRAEDSVIYPPEKLSEQYLEFVNKIRPDLTEAVENVLELDKQFRAAAAEVVEAGNLIVGIRRHLERDLSMPEVEGHRIFKSNALEEAFGGEKNLKMLSGNLCYCLCDAYSNNRVI